MNKSLSFSTNGPLTEVDGKSAMHSDTLAVFIAVKFTESLNNTTVSLKLCTNVCNFLPRNCRSDSVVCVKR